MQNTKRMVLIDERLLDTLWRKQDTNWKKPVDYKAKSLLNSQLKTDLDDSNIPDDIRVKNYQRNLNRFLHTSRKQPEPPVAVAVPEPKPQYNRKRSIKYVPEATPRIKRVVTKPKKFDWERWS